ncbi:asialoglycoprotein receptor 1 [Brienomyrus brachyistius]|uniref:asialoglycoprotein receptor 1 n=1 Tax=Brienomyrus brachyistius TaxID=42636 RepID=UPI0020B27BBF|nr:asialoglycoprotein receptor 1 [Brienomyrus brachyistius]
MKEPETRNNEYRDDFECMDTNEDRVFWKKDPAPAMTSVWRAGRSQLCVVLSVSVLLLLGLIIGLSVSNAKVDRRFIVLEDTVANISSLLTSVTTKVHMGKDTDENFHTEISKLTVSMETVEQQLTSVIKSLKAIDELEPLKTQVSELKCNIDKMIKNVTSAGCCPIDWTFYSTACYYFSREVMSWDSAKEYCTSKHSSLVILRDDAEWTFVSKRTMPNYYWIGLTDERTGDWEWVDRTPYVMNRRHWKPNQPDNWRNHGLGGGEDCAHLHNDGTLNDDHCSRLYRFVCKAIVSETPV